MYGIQDRVYQNLIRYFKRNDNIKQVTLFGSRARNTAKINSDIDLCITYCGNEKSSVQEDIDQLVGIYSCDIVFADQVNTELDMQIRRAGIVIYKKDS